MVVVELRRIKKWEVKVAVVHCRCKLIQNAPSPHCHHMSSKQYRGGQKREDVRKLYQINSGRKQQLIPALSKELEQNLFTRLSRSVATSNLQLFAEQGMYQGGNCRECCPESRKIGFQYMEPNPVKSCFKAQNSLNWVSIK